MVAVLAKKFSDPDLAMRLKKTGAKLLLEASPTDGYWGTARSKKLLARSLKYPGCNWCGVALMLVRELMFGDKPDKFVTYELTTGVSKAYASDFSDPTFIRFLSPKTPISFKLRAAIVIAHPWVREIKLTFCVSDFVTLTDTRPYLILATDSSDKETQQASLGELHHLSTSNPNTRITMGRLPLSQTEPFGDYAAMQLTAKIWDTFFDILQHELSSCNNFIWEGNFQQARPVETDKGNYRPEQKPRHSPYGTPSAKVDNVAQNDDGGDTNSNTESSSVTPSPEPLVAAGE